MDLAQRRQQLRQKQVETVKKFRQSNMSASSAIEKQKDREQMKKEIKQELSQESINIENSDGVTFARVVDIVGPSNMKPMVSNGVWKGTEQISEMNDEEDEQSKEDPALKAKQKRADQIKKQVLLKKIQAVRQGSGENIMASYDANDNIDEGSLHKWFKGSKSKDGKGGWVNVVTGGTCASDEPGEGTPKCVSSSKRASMTKAERLSASRRKKKADPGQQQKSGAAKPTYVSTDKKKMKEEITLDEKCWAGYTQKGMKKKGKKVVPNCVPVGEELVSERLGGKGYKPYTSLTGKKVSGDWEDSDRGAGNKAKKRAGGKVEKKSPTYQAYVLNKEAKEEQGRSDYGKASVRNKRKFGKEGEPAIFDASGERGKMIDKRREEHKAKRGVKEEVVAERTGSPSTTGDMNSRFWSGDKNTNYTTNVTKGGQGAVAALGAIGGAAALHYGKKAAKSIGKSVKKTKDKIKSKFKKEEYYDWRSEIDEGLTAGAIGTAAALGVVGGAASAIGNMSTRSVAKKIDKKNKKKKTDDKKEVVTEADKKGKGSGKKDACYHKVKASAKVWPSAYASGRLVQCRKKGASNYGKSKSESYSWRDDFDYVQEGAAWTKKAGKNKEGGLNEKGRKSYERENPGSDLKRPQPEGGSRKKSFCARMGGMKKKLTSSKTANDPDSRINKALRKWKC